MPSDFLFIYIPCGSAEEAQKIGRALVQEKLAACANIIKETQAIYHWKGELEETVEALLFLKTRAALYEKLVARVLELHSYDIPGIAALPVEKLNESFAGWILQQTEAN